MIGLRAGILMSEMAKKELHGSDVASFIKLRQASAVRSMKLKPTLAIVRTNQSPVTDIYLKIKKSYADDIGVNLEVIQTSDSEAIAIINTLNKRLDVHGIIVQLPLDDPSKTEDVLNSVDPAKDVDGLSAKAVYDPATPTAILWLLASYNIDLRGKKVLVIGQGRLVGAPLIKMLKNSDVDVSGADETTKNLSELSTESQIIISAVGRANLITSDMVPLGTVVVDAGTSTDNGEVVGDVSEEVRARADTIITPKRGGVGPLTVAALYENLLSATRAAS